MADLTTLDTVKEYLTIDLADLSADTTLTRLIHACSDQFERETYRHFTSQTYTDTATMVPGSFPTPRWIPQTVPIYTPIFGYPMSGYRYKFNLTEYPVTAVASVVLDGATIPASTVDASGVRSDGWYIYDGPSGVLNLQGWYNINPGVSQCVIQYTAGYSPIPYDIEQAVIEWVTWKFTHERQRMGQIAASMSGESVSYSQFDKPMSVANVIDAYRRKTIS